MSNALKLCALTVLVATFIACSEDDPVQVKSSGPARLVSYSFNGDTKDGSGNGNNGVLVGGATATGVLATGENDTDALMIPSTLIDGIGDFTVAAWVKLNGKNACCHQLISGANATQDNEFMIWYATTTGNWRMGIDNGNDQFAVDTRVEDNQWHHVAVTRSGTSAMLYLDGDPVGAAITTSDKKPVIDPGGLFLGQDQDAVGGQFAANESFNGEMDNFVIYNGALNVTAIRALRDAPR